MSETVLERFSPRVEAQSLVLPSELKQKTRKGRKPPSAAFLANSFTKETARQAQAKAVAARLSAEFLNVPIKPTAQGAKANPLENVVVSEISRVSGVLSNRRLKPSERCQLIGALDRLLDRLRILRGDPLPGSSRPKEEKPASAAVSMLGQSVTNSDARPGREDQD